MLRKHSDPIHTPDLINNLYVLSNGFILLMFALIYFSYCITQLLQLDLGYTNVLLDKVRSYL